MQRNWDLTRAKQYKMGMGLDFKQNWLCDDGISCTGRLNLVRLRLESRNTTYKHIKIF